MTTATPPQLIDPFRRAITYLRVSVTDRCDFRCLYCMAEEMTFLPKRDLLSLEELDQLCTTFIDLGVRKLRITAGAPLVRKNIPRFFDPRVPPPRAIVVLLRRVRRCRRQVDHKSAARIGAAH